MSAESAPDRTKHGGPVVPNDAWGRVGVPRRCRGFRRHRWMLHPRYTTYDYCSRCGRIKPHWPRSG